MRNITNTQEANTYYKIINDSLWEYIEKWNIMPTELKRYFSKDKINRFLEKNNISDVERIHTIFNDVIDHITHIEMDGVKKFESFESEIATNNEKILCDVYNTSLSSIDKVSKSENIYKVDDFGKKVMCLLKTEEEMESLSQNILEEMVKESMEKKLVINSVNSFKIEPIKIPLKDILNFEKIKEISKPLLNNHQIESWLSNFVLSKWGYQMNYKGLYSNTHVWELNK
jgi:hypothetical protein